MNQEKAGFLSFGESNDVIFLFTLREDRSSEYLPMLYSIIKAILRPAVLIYFRKIKVVNKERLPKKGPFIVVANHPNTFMDPFVIGGYFKPLHFLTQGGIFKQKWKHKFFRKIHMVPIYRKQDVTGTSRDNEATFGECKQFLQNGGRLVIFPEGNSFLERTLREIKTGTARIALDSEAEKNFSLGLKIVPIGLDYSAPKKFRSEVTMRIGESFTIEEYQQQFAEKPRDAVKALTDRIRDSLEKVTIAAKDAEEDRLANGIETIIRKEWPQALQGAKHEQKYVLSKRVLNALRYFENEKPEEITTLRNRITSYYSRLKELRMSDKQLSKEPLVRVSEAIKMILLLPIYLYGVLNNYIPFKVPQLLTKRIAVDPAFNPPTLLLMGILTFGFFYPLQIWGFNHFISPNGYWTLGYALSLPITGLLAWDYWESILDLQQRWRLTQLFFNRKDLLIRLSGQRKEIIDQIEKLRDEYLALEQINSVDTP